MAKKVSKLDKPIKQPFLLRMKDEFKRIRWTGPKENSGYLKNVIIWIIVASAFFLAVDQIIKAIL